MMVSANSAICTPAEPTVAGPSALKKRFTSSSSHGRRSVGHHVGAQRGAADQQHFEHAGDQHAPRRRMARRSGRTPRASSVATMVRLSRIGAAAAVAKRPTELRMPENSVTSAISSRYGKRDARERRPQARSASGSLREARREQRDHRRREDQREREQHDLARQQQREDAVAEQFRGVRRRPASRMRA